MAGATDEAIAGLSEMVAVCLCLDLLSNGRLYSPGDDRSAEDSLRWAFLAFIGIRGNAVLAVLVLEPERNVVVTNAFVRISHVTAAASRIVEELARRQISGLGASTTNPFIARARKVIAGNWFRLGRARLAFAGIWGDACLAVHVLVPECNLVVADALVREANIFASPCWIAKEPTTAHVRGLEACAPHPTIGGFG